VIACPPSTTRSPFTRTRTIPPREEAWKPVMFDFPSRVAQKGARAQCAEPVTGSSFNPRAGAKKRETKSKRGSLDRLVTMTPRMPSIFPRAAKSGFRLRTFSSEARTRNRSNFVCPTNDGSTSSTSSNPAGGSAGAEGVAGKSNSMTFPA